MGLQTSRRVIAMSSAVFLALGSGSAPSGHAADGSGRGVVVLIAGDIAKGEPGSMEAATARLIERRAGTVMTAGDNAYPHGSYDQFLQHYHPTWGRFLGRTRPALGNHEYETPGAGGYFRYFGDAAGPHGRGYYTFRLGGWQVFSLDSMPCLANVGCGPGSRQHRWLARKLRRMQGACQLAVWHHPLFTNGIYGPHEPAVLPLARLLHQAGVDIVVNGHWHAYERLAPARPSGRVDRRFGMRQFVVGTGGAALQEAGRAVPHSEVVDATTHGVLRLRLGRVSYAWRFIPIAGLSFTDRGRGRCHGRPDR